MTTYIEIKDILESKKKYGNENVLSWDPAVYRDNKQKNKNSKYDCTWIPIKFKYVNGTEVQPKIKFSNVTTSSSARLPQSEDEIKHLLISFRSVTEEELATGDLVPRTMATEAEQKIEDARMVAQIAKINKATNDFNTAMNAIDASYKRICAEIKAAKSLGFSVRKDKNVKNNDAITVYSIIQTHRENKDDLDNTIKLEHPITRIKLSVDPVTGSVGNQVWNNTKKGWDFVPMVFDARKMKASNDYKPVLATVKVDNKSCALDKDNAATFITYRSILTGTLEFPETIVSKFGFSLSNRFTKLVVKRNKSNLVEVSLTKEDLADVCSSDENDDDEAEMVTDVTHTFKKTGIKVNVDSDLEDMASDQDSDLEKVTVSKPKKASKDKAPVKTEAKKPAKAGKGKAVAEPESENEADDVSAQASDEDLEDGCEDDDSDV